MKPALAVFLRDLRLAFRSGGGAGLGLAFFVITLVLLPLGIGPETERLASVAPGLIWVAALLAALLTLDRIFATDYEDGTLDAMCLATMPTAAIAAAKGLAHWVVTGLPLTIAGPVLALSLGLGVEDLPFLMASFLVGTPALSFIGLIGAALTVGVRRGGLLLSVIVMPLYIPTLIFGAQAASAVAEGRDPAPTLLLLAGITIGSIVLGPAAASAALRINMR